MFGYTCQNYVLIAYKDLKYRSKRRMTKVSFRHIFSCASLYLFVGIFGYITFPTEAPKENLIIEYNPVKRFPFFIALIVLTISSTTALPFIVRPCKSSVLVILYPNDKEKRESNTNHYITIIVLYLLLVILTFVCVVMQFNLEQILTVISTFTSPLVRFFKLKLVFLTRIDVFQFPILLQCIHDEGQ